MQGAVSCRRGIESAVLGAHPTKRKKSQCDRFSFLIENSQQTTKKRYRIGSGNTVALKITKGR